MEWRKDILGETFYASRNFNDLAQTYRCPGSNRTQLDWNVTLRQGRKKGAISKGGSSMSRSAPNLLTSEISERKNEKDVHMDGAYHSTSDTLGKYQNFAGTVHMLHNLDRVSSGSAHTIDWQCNLRDGHHQKPADGWKRHFSRSQQSFDMMRENCAASNQEYQNSHITPQDRRPDRRVGACPTETIRDDPISFRRNPGCEGTNVASWEHLIVDRRYGHKARKQLAHETTMRTDATDTNGARIEDTRSDGCIVEMLGKKKWFGHVSPDFLSAHPTEGGDHKLFHLSRMRIQAEPDEENRDKRKNKQVRTDANISYKHTGAQRKHRED